MNVTALDDYRSWDNTEPVTLTDVAAAGDTDYDLKTAKRRALSFRELAASGGAYTAKDLVWLLPAKIVEAARAPEPEPADRITDKTGDIWTILEGTLNTWKSYYRCVTRNLILAADLRTTLSVKRSTGTATDDAGGRVYSFSEVYNAIPCRFQEVGAEISDERGQRATLKRYSVWVDRRLYLTIEDQILDADGNIYELTGWHDADRIDQLQQLDCQRRW